MKAFAAIRTFTNGWRRGNPDIQVASGKNIVMLKHTLGNPSEFGDILHHLNCRVGLTALSLWKGERPRFDGYRLYAGFEGFLTRETLDRVAAIEDERERHRIKFAFMDHYLQRHLYSHDTEFRAWSSSAAAHVNGQKIYFREVIPWCQKSSTRIERLQLQKETTALCRFLKPFAINYWKELLELLKADFGIDAYIDFCQEKKGIDYPLYYQRIKQFLKDSEGIYFAAMEKWSRNRFGLPLSDLTRFDAINLLGLSEFDRLCPSTPAWDYLPFFKHWDMDPQSMEGLTLYMGTETRKSAQAMSFIVQVPEEIYLVMKPTGGWIDLETLWHELGHGLSAVYTSPKLSMSDRNLAVSFNLSEAYAFLLQNLTLTRPFLTSMVGLTDAAAATLEFYKELKDFSSFRRYCAKFIAEYEMFDEGDLSKGQNYADLMRRHTGFYHQPDSHLFDLVPEFYCLDYLLGWMAESLMREYFSNRFGATWMFRAETGEVLRGWWAEGNRLDIFDFMEAHDLGRLSMAHLLARWEALFDR